MFGEKLWTMEMVRDIYVLIETLVVRVAPFIPCTCNLHDICGAHVPWIPEEPRWPSNP